MAAPTQVVRFKGRARLDLALVKHVRGEKRPDTALRIEVPAILLGGNLATARLALKAAILARLSMPGVKPRHALDVMVAGPKRHASQGAWTEEEVRAWAKETYDWVVGVLGPNSVVAASSVHMDEASPHFHLLAVPINSEGLLGWKRVAVEAAQKRGLKLDRKDTRYRALQDDYHRVVGAKYGLARGNVGSKAQHKPVDRDLGLKATMERQAHQAEKQAEDREWRLSEIKRDVELTHREAEVVVERTKLNVAKLWEQGEQYKEEAQSEAVKLDSVRQELEALEAKRDAEEQEARTRAERVAERLDELQRTADLAEARAEAAESEADSRATAAEVQADGRAEAAEADAEERVRKAAEAAEKAEVLAEAGASSGPAKRGLLVVRAVEQERDDVKDELERAEALNRERKEALEAAAKRESKLIEAVQPLRERLREFERENEKMERERKRIAEERQHIARGKETAADLREESVRGELQPKLDAAEKAAVEAGKAAEEADRLRRKEVASGSFQLGVGFGLGRADMARDMVVELRKEKLYGRLSQEFLAVVSTTLDLVLPERVVAWVKRVRRAKLDKNVTPETRDLARKSAPVIEALRDVPKPAAGVERD